LRIRLAETAQNGGLQPKSEKVGTLWALDRDLKGR
jgi:hypothetical protein